MLTIYFDSDTDKKLHITMKKIFPLVFTLLCSFFGWGQTTDLFISEYVEGSSSNKYIEIYNGTGTSVDLSNYRLRLYANGSSSTTNDVQLSGTIANGAVVVYSNSSATIYTGTTIVNAAVNFNGDDAIALFKISTNANVDIFGRIGNDPGTAWTATGYSTENRTLRRKSSVCGGITVNPTGTGSGAFTTLSTEWDAFNIDDISNLGSHTANCNSITPTINVSPSTLSGFTYFVGSGPSASQSFAVSAVNLTTNLILSAPANYEISLTAGSGYTNILSLVPSSGIVASTTIYVRLIAGLSIGNYNSENITITSTGASSQTVTCSGSIIGSSSSDIISLGGESTFVSSLINDAIVTTTAQGVQVWEFRIRDGGATIDADNLPTIVNSITLTQNVGNQINDWADAIQSVALFNGSTKIAEGVVSTNQIVFSGAPLISVPDNGTITLTVRLSVETNPNNSGSNLDGDDFVFNILNANAIAASTGSQFATFSTPSSSNGQNILSIVATHLTYLQQPSNAGINTGMADVIVAATDTNGNIDLDYSGNIILTSTGTMSGSPLTQAALSGTTIFSNIIHTTLGTFFNLNASSSGLISATSIFFDITDVTTLGLGDLAILAVNTNNGSGEEFAFVCFQDILPGTEFFITDNGYERVTAGLWADTEGVIKIRRTGTTLPKGSIINIICNIGGVSSGNDFVVRTCGVEDNNWVKDQINTGFSFDLNKDDQIWFIQGGTFINPVGSHNATFTGTVLYGWTDIPWKTAPNYDSTAGSTIYPGLNCYNTDVINTLGGSSFVKFDDPINPDFSSTSNAKLDWIALINNPNNWNAYTSNANYNANGYNYRGNTACTPMTIATSSYINGKWTGKQDTNWFNCGNWDTLKVPDETVDVLVENTTFNNAAIVDITASFASDYGNIAKTNSLTITGERVEVTANVNNILEVHGNLTIDGTGVLDMNDGNDATADGTIRLYGDWSNLINETAFDQGNGTVHFEGSIPQIVTSLDPIGTEVFYNVVLNNDFDTTISNNLIAEGNLTVNATKLLSIQSDDYVQVNNTLQLNGNIIIENDGQLIQVNETDTNSGTYTGTKFQVKRTAQARNLDYVYWSSPVENFNVLNLPNSNRYEWLPTVLNANNTQGNWSTPFGNMLKGQGYIARASNGSAVAIDLPIIFQGGKPHNGQFNYTISRGSTIGINDCWNLVGNPYPSAIDADLFLADNPAIEGSVRIWTHGTLPQGNPTPTPFYQNFAYNYTEDDYIIYNGTATTVPSVFDGKIASGQGFFVRMLEDGETDVNPPVSEIIPAATNITFKNEYRSDVINGYLYGNSAFFRSSNPQAIEKSRIWLDLIAPNNQITKTVVGYVSGATLAKDRIYDALINVNSFKLYSLIDTQKQAIQGRPVPFDINDQVPLGVYIQAAGSYTIAISTVDGLFSDVSQNIFLEDKLLNIIHDLKQTPYTFSTIVGEFNDRFVLRYTNTVLSNQEYNATSGLIIVSNEQVSLLAAEPIKSVLVFDLLGRKIYEKNDINVSQLILEELMSNKETLVVKTTFENGNTITRKIIY